MERVVSVRPLANYMLEIEFQDGLRKVIDIRPFLGKGIFAPLEDGGGITWPNGFDFCPNFLRDDVPAVNVVTASFRCSGSPVQVGTYTCTPRHRRPGQVCARCKCRDPLLDKEG